jgi:hypothetical protein
VRESGAYCRPIRSIQVCISLDWAFAIIGIINRKQSMIFTVDVFMRVFE